MPRGSDLWCPRRRRRSPGAANASGARPEPPFLPPAVADPAPSRAGCGLFWSLLMETQERERRTRKSNGRYDAEAKGLDQRKLLRVLQAVRDGDFSVRLASDQTGLAGKVADTFNEIVRSNQRPASRRERAGQNVGKAG